MHRKYAQKEKQVGWHIIAGINQLSELDTHMYVCKHLQSWTPYCPSFVCNFLGRPLICFVHDRQSWTLRESWTRLLSSIVQRPRFEYSYKLYKERRGHMCIE